MKHICFAVIRISDRSVSFNLNGKVSAEKKFETKVSSVETKVSSRETKVSTVETFVSRQETMSFHLSSFLSPEPGEYVA